MSRLFLTLICLFSVTAKATTDREWAIQHLLPLIQDRKEFYKINLVEGDPAKVVLISTSNGHVLGRYEIALTSKSKELPKLAPHLNLKAARAGSAEYAQIEATVELPLEPNENPTPVLRSLLRSDFLLHPMQTPPGREPKLSPVQWDVIRQVEDHIVAAEDRGEIARSIVILPPGFGKTVIAGKLLQREFVEHKDAYKIFFVVQNKDILDEAAGKLQKMLGLKPAEVLRAYGEGSREDIAGSSAKLIATTRTTLFRNLGEILAVRQSFKGRYAIVFDEAHHAGKLNGEFDAILQQFISGLKKQDFLLGLTATPWHNDSDIIDRLFHNQVATALISQEEREAFLRDRRLIYMARLMLFRAMAEGYLSPILAYRQIRYLEREGDVPVLSRTFLNDWTEKFVGLDEAKRIELLEKEIVIHYPLIAQMVKEIRQTVKKDAAGRLITPNRGIIFVPSIAHANVYAYLLNQRSPKGEGGIYAKPYHSDLNDQTRAETMDWFRDEDQRKSSYRRTDRIEGAKAKVHKYLFAIRALGEGVDEPRINHIILAKPYSDEDVVGMRDLIQNLGRGSRLAYPKADFTVSDFTGDMQRLIFKGLERSLVDKFFVHGGEQDFAPTPSEEEFKKEREVTAVVDFAKLDPEQFDTTAVSIPERHFTGPVISQSVTVTPSSNIKSVFGSRYKWSGVEDEGVTWREFLKHPVSLPMLSEETQWLYRNSRSRTHYGRAPIQMYDTLHQMLEESPQGWSKYFTGGGGKSLSRMLRHHRIVDERGQMTPELIANFDKPTPWSKAQLDEALQSERFVRARKIARAPTLLQSMLKNRYEYLKSAGLSVAKWDDVLSNPAFTLLVTLHLMPELPERERNAILKTPISMKGLMAGQSFEFLKWYPTPLWPKYRDRLIAEGLHADADPNVVSPFRMVDLLELPDEFVWQQTEPFGDQDSRGTGSTIRGRLAFIAMHGSEEEFEDYRIRASLALGYDLPVSRQGAQSLEMAGADSRIEVAKIKAAFREVPRARPKAEEAAIEGVTYVGWEQFLTSTEGLKIFVEQTLGPKVTRYAIASIHSIKAYLENLSGAQIISRRADTDPYAVAYINAIDKEVREKFEFALKFYGIDLGSLKTLVKRQAPFYDFELLPDSDYRKREGLLKVRKVHPYFVKTDLREALFGALGTPRGAVFATWREVFLDFTLGRTFIEQLELPIYVQSRILDALEGRTSIFHLLLLGRKISGVGKEALQSYYERLKEFGFAPAELSHGIMRSLDGPSSFLLREGKISVEPSTLLQLLRQKACESQLESSWGAWRFI